MPYGTSTVLDAATGSPYWLSRAGRLGFDPRRDVKGVEDLALFPDLTDELRDVRVTDPVPGGYGSKARGRAAAGSSSPRTRTGVSIST
ncbi:hypothetical protein ACGH7X_37205 [Streptomyces sp. BBFR51]|uniref:hypothetical protein n=1 Tax=Streptomyces sp. BBFR51 TaxID=3372856 RepID=UPI0037DDC398